MQTDTMNPLPAHKRGNTVLVFAAIICLIASFLLAGISVILKPTQKANELDYELRNVLKAFAVPITYEEDGKIIDIPTEEVAEFFTNNISLSFINAEDGSVIEQLPELQEFKKAIKEKTILPLYSWYEDKAVMSGTKPTMYAYPTSGMGLWGKVYGFIGLEGDLSTIKNIAFYKHQETPGLGAEVVEDWFTNQFIGKKLLTEAGDIADFKVAKGKSVKDMADDIHGVAGISAATITANGVQKFIVEDMELYNRHFVTLRGTSGSKEN